MDSLILVTLGIVIFPFLWVILFPNKKQKNISGKVALVTGGGNGLGREICLELARKGCKIAIADIDYEGAETTVRMLNDSVDAKAYRVDLCQKEEIALLKNRIDRDFGVVDILVNNAGLISYNTIFSETEDFIEKMTKVNLIAVIWMTKLFLRDMIERKSGHIVTISSLAGLYHHAYGVTYAATKFGVTGFMLALREFLRRRKLDKNIYTTIIMPDAISTREDVVSAVSKK